MKFMARFTALMGLLGVVGSLLGCGEKLVLVKGKVHSNGQVLPVKDSSAGGMGKVRVTFFPIYEDDRAIYPQIAVVNHADGSFTVPGQHNQGIPPGKYKLTVVWKDDFPMGPDKLNSAFSLEKTQILRDVTGGEEIDINVANPPTGK